MSSDNGTLARIGRIEAHHRLLISTALAACTLAVLFKYVSLTVALITAWNVFAILSLIFSWLGMFFTDVKKRIKEARLQDSSRTSIFFVTVLASFAGLAGGCILLASAKSLHGVHSACYVGLAALTVISSWTLVHTILSQHYAHLFYDGPAGDGGFPSGSGLSFPEEKEPDFLDFAYFSFVIGMTFQVSDVEVTSRSIRRTVLLHSLLSFAFNTVIVAFSINLAASLLS